MGKLLNYDNNETYDCYINEDRGYELNLNECGYEKCSPCHYWEGQKILSLSLYPARQGSSACERGSVEARTPGAGFFVSPYDKIYYEADENEPWEYIWIGFSGISAKSIMQYSTLLKTNIQDVKNEKQLLGLYRNIAFSSRKGDTAYLLVLSGLYRFIAYLLENYGIDRLERDLSVKEQNFRKIIKMIDSKYMSNVSAEELANVIGYEKTYVYRMFKEMLSISPQKYIAYRRIYEAMQYLKSGGHESLEEIAAKVGFIDYSVFYRTFKSLAGMTPNEYREKAKGNTIESLHLKEFDELEKKIDKFRS